MHISSLKYAILIAISAKIAFAMENNQNLNVQVPNIQAPMLTNKDFFEELIMDQAGKISIPIQQQRTEVEYVEADNLGAWLQGKQTAIQYTNDVMQNIRPALQSQILNQNNKFILVNNSNTGNNKFFHHLNHNHYGKLACKYVYSIPYLNGIIYGDYGRQANIYNTDFTIYLLLDNPPQLQPQQQVEHHEVEHHEVDDEQFIQDVIRNFDLGNQFPNFQQYPPLRLNFPLNFPQLHIQPQQVNILQQINVQPIIPTGHTVKMYKGKQWLFKGNMPIRQL